MSVPGWLVDFPRNANRTKNSSPEERNNHPCAVSRRLIVRSLPCIIKGNSRFHVIIGLAWMRSEAARAERLASSFTQEPEARVRRNVQPTLIVQPLLSFPSNRTYASSFADFPTNLLPVTRDSSLLSTIGFARDRSVVSSLRARSLRNVRRIVIALEQRVSVNLPNDRLVCLRENTELLLVGAIDDRLSDY